MGQLQFFVSAFVTRGRWFNNIRYLFPRKGSKGRAIKPPHRAAQARAGAPQEAGAGAQSSRYRPDGHSASSTPQIKMQPSPRWEKKDVGGD